MSISATTISNLTPRTAGGASVRTSASTNTAVGPDTGTSTSTGRDAAIDLLRAGSLTVIIALHALMVGVRLTPEGPVFLNAMDGQPWFAAATWIVQVMPVFFIVGGFSSLRSWRRAQASGTSAARFVAMRLHRLLVPSLVMLVTVTAILLAMLLLG
ncbi:MAG: acyltransferase family protein, partial [Mycetocola sp.]